MAARLLSVSYEKIGDILAAQGNPTEALKSYQAGKAIAERLAAQDPSNSQWQQDLIFVYKRIADLQFRLSNMPEAVNVAKSQVTHLTRRWEAKNDESTKKELAEAYLSLSWYELFNHHPQEAIAASLKGLELNPTATAKAMIKTTLAHGYLFSNQFEKAKAIYLAEKDASVGEGRTFSRAVLDDFRQFKEKGLPHPRMKEVERLLKGSGSKGAQRE